MHRLLVVSLSLGLVLACTKSRTLEDPDTGPARVDAGPPVGDAGEAPVPDGGERECLPETDAVDLLFMIDDSGSMAEEQASLAAELPRLVRALSTGDLDGDGALDFAPVGSLQVGVVTSDMGTAGARVPTCNRPELGDDGVLRVEGNSAISGCATRYPPFLSWESGAAIDAYASDVACVAQVGTAGCGFEQQLESVLKAVTPSDSRIRFYDGTPGHGDTQNSGFLRPDAVLAVVVVTDEEDCSVADGELFDPGSTRYSGDLNLRCFSHPGAVHPVQRYADGILAAKRNPSRVVFTAITGVPTDLGGDDYDTMLADERMQERLDPTFGNRLMPSCDTPGRGLAFPPRRIVQTARGLSERGARTTIESVCQADFDGPFRAIITQIGRATRATCTITDTDDYT